MKETSMYTHEKTINTHQIFQLDTRRYNILRLWNISTHSKFKILMLHAIIWLKSKWFYIPLIGRDHDIERIY